MKGLFQCDSLWCCWATLMEILGRAAWAVRWPVAIYAALYAVGAGIFLLTLRLQSEDGGLIVDQNSWAYMLAYPMRYGGHRSEKRTATSICSVYAKLFNMLLFVWPVLLVYFAVTCVIGTAWGLLLFGAVVYPDLHGAGFITAKRVTGNFWPGAVTVPLTALILAGWKIKVLIHFAVVVGWYSLCLAPILVAIAIGTYLVLRYRSPNPNAVSAAVEYAAARKGKFCKMVAIR